VVRLHRYVNRFRGFERDAKVFLAGSLLASAAMSLYWIDFNLYLAALGHSAATIGLIATVSSLAATLVAFPMSVLSDRIGRKLVLLLGGGLMAIGLAGLLATTALPALWAFGAIYAAGQQTVGVVGTPYMTEHSRPNQRSELFSLQFAILQATSVVAGLVGGLIAVAVGGSQGDPGGVYRVVLLVQLGFMLGSIVLTSRLTRDRPRAIAGPSSSAPARVAVPMTGATTTEAAGALATGAASATGGAEAPGAAAATREVPATTGPATRAPATVTPSVRRFHRPRLGVTISDRSTFVRLLVPGFLISLGAGQIIPFLNLFVTGKFGVDLAGISWIYALTSLGTMVAILLQPALAARYGKVASVVIVQGASIPFLVVLGFSPLLWSVIVAMAVRNSLMNAGNPIQNAFAMERIRPSERAVLAAAMSATWSLGWVIAGPWYSFLQATLGFRVGYNVGFATIIVLYSVATALYWLWFHGDEARQRGESRAQSPSSSPAPSAESILAREAALPVDSVA